MPHKLFLTTKSRTKIRNVLTYVKLSKAQFSKINQSGGRLGKVFNLGKTVLLEFAIPLAKDVWPKLATKAASSVLDNFGGKWERCCNNRRKIYFISFK